MRTVMLPVAFLMISAPLLAQLTAGEIPAGSIAYTTNIDLNLTTQFTSDSADVELDCDDFGDVRAQLFRGAPEVDAPHVAMLHFVDNDIEVCTDLTTGFQLRPKFYSFSEVLACVGNFDWLMGDQLVLGDLGGFTGIGPTRIDSMYIAYRRGNEMGWILLSFDLESPEISLQIHHVLPICQGPNSIEQYEAPTPVSLFPNPSNGGSIRVESPYALMSLEFLDPTGRVIAQYNGNTRTMAAPERSGTYFLRATDTNGLQTVTRFVQQ